MSYPGIVAVLLGVSLATLLYYMFGQNEEQENQHRTYWEEHSENCHGRSRSCSNAGNADECSICLSHITPLNRIQLRPCEHTFHFRCIKTWNSEGEQGNYCPNCRRPYRNTF